MIYMNNGHAKRERNVKKSCRPAFALKCEIYLTFKCINLVLTVTNPNVDETVSLKRTPKTQSPKISTLEK